MGRPAVFGAADASERASEMFLRTGAFFSSILSEFLKNLVALQLAELGIKDLSQGKLPDIVAYSAEKDWIYLIEAYHTSNPITAERKYELEQMMGECADKCIYITAFESNDAFRSCKEDLAWETEVWIVTNPDHMIHRNGFRFIGPYGKTTE